MAGPRFSVCELSTFRASFEDDLEACRAGGADGVGVCEFKLPEGGDAAACAALRAAGLPATICLPGTISVLPLPLLPGPESPEERVEALCAGIRRLAQLEPAAVLCLTGPAGDRDPDEARRLAVEGVREAARTAREAGVRLGVEPIHSSIAPDWSFVTTIPEAVAFLDEVGDPELGIMFDVWHLWDAPELERHIAEQAHRFVGVHVNDRRDPTRGWADRALPGEGVAPLPRILGALDRAGYDGWYDLEIFSDDGAFGSDYGDSLWKLDPAELVRRGRAGFLEAWERRS